MDYNDFYDNMFDIERESAKRRNRKIIITIFTSVFAILAIAVVVLAIAFSGYRDAENDGIIAQNPSENSAYDSGDALTGGESPDLPKNQTLNFLSGYDIDTDNIDIIETEIRRKVDDFYLVSGYNAIYYDINNVKTEKYGDVIIFTFRVDNDKKTFTTTITLDGDEIDSIEIK